MAAPQTPLRHAKSLILAGFRNSGADVDEAYSAGEHLVRGSSPTPAADAHAMQECLNRKVQSCIKDCEDNYGYSHEQCVKNMCTLNQFNLSIWLPACTQEVKRRAERESESDD